MPIWDNRWTNPSTGICSMEEEFYETLEQEEDGRYNHQILENWGQVVYSMCYLRPSKCREWFIQFGIPIPVDLIGKEDPRE